jgi:hypothetical protein
MGAALAEQVRLHDVLQVPYPKEVIDEANYTLRGKGLVILPMGAAMPVLQDDGSMHWVNVPPWAVHNVTTHTSLVSDFMDRVSKRRKA